MRSTATLALVLTLSGCTSKQMGHLLTSLSNIALEVCVEGDSVRACLKKCDAEERRRATDP